MSGSVVADRLQREHGVVFREDKPTRAQYSRHGNLADTFLVSERVLYAGRVQTSTIIPWEYTFLDMFNQTKTRRGIEVALGRPARELAKARALDVQVCDHFSGYGLGLWVEVDEADAHVKAARDLSFLTERGYRYEK